jgi:putative ABC transport system ATP-binding protein
MAMLEEINRSGTTIVMVTHDPDLAARAHRNIHILDGRASDLPLGASAKVARLPEREPGHDSGRAVGHGVAWEAARV